MLVIFHPPKTEYEIETKETIERVQKVIVSKTICVVWRQKAFELREREREREREEYHFYLLPKIVHHPKIAFPVSISLQGKVSTNETSHMLALWELSLRCKEMPFEGGDISIFSLRGGEGEAYPSPTPPRPRHCVDIALSFFLWGGRGLKGPSWLQFCC